MAASDDKGQVDGIEHVPTLDFDVDTFNQSVDSAYRILKRGLSESAIDRTDIDMLQDTYTTMTEFISSVLRSAHTAPPEQAARAARVAEAFAERRQYVANRIVDLSRQSEIAEIKQTVEAEVDDPAVRKNISDKVDEIAKRQEEAAADWKFKDNTLDAELRRLAAQKQRIDNLMSMFQREPAAVLVGGVLLLLLTIVLVVAMFIHTSVPEVITSMVLLILGFFFGQTTSRKSDDS
ncbi:hypothetical protein [Nocardia alni]|uniref:hypothetical protein n=1 Tax=Nocardia alni TaxID=2815723 RepID=UPI001C22208A|nr:hypothetical protein [Nocardia alni]